ncbi:MAG: hypothetical protein RR593_11665, partial [Hungatella sp.]
YMNEGSLKVQLLGRGMAWLDTGTHSSMLQASNFVEAVQSTQGTFIACLEEIAYRKGWIDSNQMRNLAKPLIKTAYGKSKTRSCGYKRIEVREWVNLELSIQN